MNTPKPDSASAPVHHLVGRLRELLRKVPEAPLLYDTCVIASEAWRDKNGMIHYEAYGGPLAEGDPKTLRLCVAAVNALPALLAIAEAAAEYDAAGWIALPGGISDPEAARLRMALSLLPNSVLGRTPPNKDQ
jgi:hypothetical protein